MTAAHWAADIILASVCLFLVFLNFALRTLASLTKTASGENERASRKRGRRVSARPPL